MSLRAKPFTEHERQCERSRAFNVNVPAPALMCTRLSPDVIIRKKYYMFFEQTFFLQISVSFQSKTCLNTEIIDKNPWLIRLVLTFWN